MKITKERIDNIINEVLSRYSSSEQNVLTEMARVDNPKTDASLLGTKEIWIYGNDRSSMFPHFHYVDKKNNPFSLEIRIEDLSICNSAPRAEIPKNRLRTWDGLFDAKNILSTWLKTQNNDFNALTNYQVLIATWNQNNRNNEVIIKDIETVLERFINSTL